MKFHDEGISKTCLDPQGFLNTSLVQVVLFCHKLSRFSMLTQVAVVIMALVGGLWLSIFSGLIAAIMTRLAWLQYLYYLSYIKVGTTPIKYTPQVSE